MKKFGLFIGALIVTAAAMVHGAALTADRDTPSRSGESISLTQGSNTIYAGSIVCVDSSGYAVPGADASGYMMVGRASKYSQNQYGNYSSTKKIAVDRGVFRWANGATYTDAAIGDFAYIFDDQTVNVAGSNTYDIVAGLIVDVDDSGVWVDCLAAGGQGSESLSSLAVSGNSAITGDESVGGTLAVTGVGTFTATPVCRNGLTVNTNLNVGGATTTATLRVTGASVLSGAATISGAASFGTNLTITSVSESAAATNDAAYSIGITVHGTNYFINLIPANT